MNQPETAGDTDLVGLELGFDGTIGENWAWDTGYTALKVEDDVGPHNRFYDGVDATPSHTLNAHLGYQNGSWEADAYGQYISDYDVLFTTASNTYVPVESGDRFSFAGRLAYNINENVTLAISGSELTHSETTETSGPKKDRQVFLTLSSSF